MVGGGIVVWGIIVHTGGRLSGTRPMSAEIKDLWVFLTFEREVTDARDDDISI